MVTAQFSPFGLLEMCYRPSLQEELMVVDKNRRIFVQTGFVDMRKQINGLSAYIQEHVPEGP
jgi:hypothetical protein